MAGSFGKALQIGFPLLSFLFMAFQPSLLQLYFASTGLFALGQSHLVTNNSFRKWMNMEIASRHLNPDRLDSETIRLTAQLEEERNRALNPSQPSEHPNISSIDKYLNRAKDFKNNFTAEASEKLRSIQGNGPGVNADGSPAAPPRYTEAELRAAKNYEIQEKDKAFYAREERNKARQRAYQEKLKAEKHKAQVSWQRQRDAARNKQSGRQK